MNLSNHQIKPLQQQAPVVPLPGQKAIYPELARQILSVYGLQVTKAQAKAVTEFLYTLAKNTTS